MKKTIFQMLGIIGLAFLFGLGRNYLGKNPLPLFRYQPKPATQPVISAQFQEVDAELVRQMVHVPSVLLLDARQPEFFATGHIPFARNLPIGEFDRAFSGMAPMFQGRDMIIVYCQGKGCHDSMLLVQKLWERRYRNLFLYHGGMEEWMEKGYDVEK